MDVIKYINCTNFRITTPALMYGRYYFNYHLIIPYSPNVARKRHGDGNTHDRRSIVLVITNF